MILDKSNTNGAILDKSNKHEWCDINIRVTNTNGEILDKSNTNGAILDKSNKHEWCDINIRVTNTNGENITEK